MSTDPTPTPPELDLAALRKIVDGATDGPWSVYDRGIGFEVYAGEGYTLNSGQRETFGKQDATHIATFDPPTVLALIARVEKQDRMLARADGEVELLRGTVNHDGEELAKLTARVEAAEAKIAAVRELHSKTPVHDDQCDDSDCGLEHFEAMDNELYHCATVAYYACEECHKMTDGELDAYPCPTIAALDGTA